MDSSISIKFFAIRVACFSSLLLVLFASFYQAKAADKPPCDKPVCSNHLFPTKMEPNGYGGYFCLWCIQDAINQVEDDMKTQQACCYAAETDSDDASLPTHGDDLCDLMPGGTLTADTPPCGTTSEATTAHAAEEDRSPSLLRAFIPRLYDLHEAMSALHNSLPESPLDSPPTGPESEKTSVQVSEASSVAQNLIDLLEQAGFTTSSTDVSALPRGEGIELLRGNAELPDLVPLLSKFNIKFADQSLLNLKSLLLSGKYLIIRMIQKDGMITLIHIHPIENQQALIITELGLQSSPICTEYLTIFLSFFLNREEVTELAVFTHEAVPDDPTPSSEGATAGATLTDSLTVAITEYIQQLGVSSPEHPPIEHTDAIRELEKTKDQAELALSMLHYGFQPGPTEGGALQNVEALTGAQTPFMAQLMTPDQQVTVINFQPEASGNVMLSLSGSHFVIDRREIGALFDWIINQFKPVIQLFIMAPLYF